MLKLIQKLTTQVQEQQKDIIFLHKTILEILDLIKIINRELEEIKKQDKL